MQIICMQCLHDQIPIDLLVTYSNFASLLRLRDKFEIKDVVTV